jgi:hypothetical protein
MLVIQPDDGVVGHGLERHDKKAGQQGADQDDEKKSDGG